MMALSKGCYPFDNKQGKCGKETAMEEEMQVAELLVEKTEEAMIRKILDIVKESESIADAVEKIEALLK